MTQWISEYYFWIKALHLIAVFAWMAGLFYLPRLFVYHTQHQNNQEIYDVFLGMERKLLKIIMNPAMILSWIFGILLILYHIDSGTMQQGWLHTKLLCVVLITLFHKICILYYRRFAQHRNQKTEKFFRLFNEVPTILMIIIVVMAIVQPF